MEIVRKAFLETFAKEGKGTVCCSWQKETVSHLDVAWLCKQCEQRGKKTHLGGIVHLYFVQWIEASGETV